MNIFYYLRRFVGFIYDILMTLELKYNGGKDGIWFKNGTYIFYSKKWNENFCFTFSSIFYINNLHKFKMKPNYKKYIRGKYKFR